MGTIIIILRFSNHDAVFCRFPTLAIAKMGYSFKLLGTTSAGPSLRIILYVRYHDHVYAEILPRVSNCGYCRIARRWVASEKYTYTSVYYVLYADTS